MPLIPDPDNEVGFEWVKAYEPRGEELEEVRRNIRAYFALENPQLSEDDRTLLLQQATATEPYCFAELRADDSSRYFLVLPGSSKKTQCLGSGACGTVLFGYLMEAKLNTHGKEWWDANDINLAPGKRKYVAIKKMKSDTPDKHVAREIKYEVAFNRRVYQFGEKYGDKTVILPFLPGTNFAENDYSSSSPPVKTSKSTFEIDNLSLEERVSLACELMMAYNFLHIKEYSHNDVKGSNFRVLKRKKNAFDNLFDVYLCDFGMSQRVSADYMLRSRSSAYGTPIYAPYEVLFEKWRGTSSDVYGLAASMYRLFGVQSPAESKNKYSENIQKVLEKKYANKPNKEDYTHQVTPEISLIEYDTTGLFQGIADISLSEEPLPGRKISEKEEILSLLKNFIAKMARINYFTRKNSEQTLRFFLALKKYLFVRKHQQDIEAHTKQVSEKLISQYKSEIDIENKKPEPNQIKISKHAQAIQELEEESPTDLVGNPLVKEAYHELMIADKAPARNFASHDPYALLREIIFDDAYWQTKTLHVYHNVPEGVRHLRKIITADDDKRKMQLNSSEKSKLIAKLDFQMALCGEGHKIEQRCQKERVDVARLFFGIQKRDETSRQLYELLASVSTERLNHVRESISDDDENNMTEELWRSLHHFENSLLASKLYRSIVNDYRSFQDEQGAKQALRLESRINP